MQTTTQPQTTDNSLGRDASVQIPENLSSQALEDKYKCIYQGVQAKMRTEHGTGSGSSYEITIADMSLYSLSMIIASLTSASKDDRERAKKEVRELVKLSRKAAE